METQPRFFVSADKSLLDIETIHGFLTNCHWAKGISRELVEKSIRHSLCFGVYEVAQGKRKQVGFARVISDFATFAYLSDVFVLETHRGNDLSKLLLGEIMKHPELQGLRRWMLVTTNAHGLYERFGFAAPAFPEKIMEIFVPNLYEKEAELLRAIESEKTCPK
ncbi:MAG: GNAT family N-acetyltransferase [Chloroherpetonaceae bacterium]|nr:GNAT family N-acetyltransferase [Chloroherpetonaceae bacterium]MDW8438587.1 GNAT family N-acetyltransferase [Chloroherpetonaceae bacterium]